MCRPFGISCRVICVRRRTLPLDIRASQPEEHDPEGNSPEVCPPSTTSLDGDKTPDLGPGPCQVDGCSERPLGILGGFLITLQKGKQVRLMGTLLTAAVHGKRRSMSRISLGSFVRHFKQL